jgi:hypothetical protein
MPIAKARAAIILTEFDQAQAELVGKAVILTDGKAGTVDNIWLDALHGVIVQRLPAPRACHRSNGVFASV